MESVDVDEVFNDLVGPSHVVNEVGLAKRIFNKRRGIFR